MTTRTLTDADIKAMLGPMHAAYLEAVRADTKARSGDEALMRQVLDDICGAKLCEVNSMSSRAEMIRLMDKAIASLKERLA